MEAFYEQNLTNEKMNAHSKRTRILAILTNCLWGVSIFIGILHVILAIIVRAPAYLLFGVALCIPFVTPAFFLRRYILRSNCEYDYILTGDTLRIVKVVRRLKRKLVETIPLSSVVSMGRINSEGYEKIFASKDIKKKFAICDYDAVDKIAYIVYRNEGEKIVTHIEPDDGLITALRKCLPRLGIIDKSLYTPIGGTSA